MCRHVSLKAARVSNAKQCAPFVHGHKNFAKKTNTETEQFIWPIVSLVFRNMRAFHALSCPFHAISCARSTFCWTQNFLRPLFSTFWCQRIRRKRTIFSHNFKIYKGRNPGYLIQIAELEREFLSLSIEENALMQPNYFGYRWTRQLVLNRVSLRHYSCLWTSINRTFSYRIVLCEGKRNRIKCSKKGCRLIKPRKLYAMYFLFGRLVCRRTANRHSSVYLEKESYYLCII